VANEDLTIKLGLTGQEQTVRGIEKTAAAVKLVQDAQGRWRTENGKFASSAEKAAAGVDQVDRKSRSLGATVKDTGAKLNVFGGALGYVQRRTELAGAGFAALTLAGAKWGLQTNAQVEQARLRFTLFTNDVDGLTNSVRRSTRTARSRSLISRTRPRSSAAPGSRTSPVSCRPPRTRRPAAGRAPPAYRRSRSRSARSSRRAASARKRSTSSPKAARSPPNGPRRRPGLTQKQMQNLGNNGIEASKAIDVLTKAWTSGPMGDIAKRQTQDARRPVEPAHRQRADRGRRRDAEPREGAP
jgi:hypothetical protein